MPYVTELSKAIPFDALAMADLVVDAVYAGGPAGTVADDPLGRLLPVGNQGGFRYKGSPERGDVRLVVLYTSGADPDWPDVLDEQSGLFTYYGDNKSPGQQLHSTQRRGNVILRDAFAACHSSEAERMKVPPFLLFSKAKARGRDVQFRGLLAPGGAALTADDDLQAIWRSTRGNRFQNYRARFTVLDVPVVSRRWIAEALSGDPLGPTCPVPWRDWVHGRSYQAMVAPATRVIRSRAEQLPQPADRAGQQILQAVYSHFAGSPHAFESCAVELWRMAAPATGAVTITRPSVDHGRDAIGVYRLGPPADRISLDFVLEAKCYAPDNSIGVEPMARLISRLRHRMFGVLVTTSYVHNQAYGEVREDQHPIVIISGGDIVEILRSHGYSSVDAVRIWLDSAFPPDAAQSRGSR